MHAHALTLGEALSVVRAMRSVPIRPNAGFLRQLRVCEAEGGVRALLSRPTLGECGAACKACGGVFERRSCAEGEEDEESGSDDVLGMFLVDKEHLCRIFERLWEGRDPATVLTLSRIAVQ